jgi:hypothetical protein
VAGLINTINMKAKFLKIAGVKNEEQFYKKYPTEAAFFKAHPEAKKQVKKAETGFSGFLENIGGAQGLTSVATDIIGGIQQLKAQKQAVKSAEQASKVSDVAAQAAATRPEIPSRKYVRPEDMLTNPNERFMSYGTGTNILAEEGAMIGGNPTEIQNMYNPGTLYSDLGFEPLADSDKVKQYKKGGGLLKAPDGTELPGGMMNTTLGGGYLWQPGSSNLPVGSNISSSNQQFNIPQSNPGEFSINMNPSQFAESRLVKNKSNEFSYNNKSGGSGRKGAGFDFNTFAQQGGTDIAGQLAGVIPGVGQDAGSSIGGGVGRGIGTAIGGPIGGMVGNFAGRLIGGLVDRSDEKIKRFNEKTQNNIGNIALQQGAQSLQGQFSGFVRNGGDIPVGEDGWVSHDWQPQKIVKFGGHNVKDLLKRDETMDTLRTGGNIRQNYMGPQDQLSFGGEMKTHWGGYAEPISYNPYLPGTGETVMFRGQSHDESDGKGRTGIGVSYGDTGNDDYTDYAEYGSKSAEDKVDVEVERDEPAIETQDVNGDKSMLVYGNLKIPKQFASEIGDPRLDHKNLPKFKNYVAKLSKEEEKANNRIARSVEISDNVNPITSFDKLALNTQKTIIDANNMKLKKIAVYKQNAAALQQAINDTGEELGLDADALAKGKTKAAKVEEGAKDGKSIPKGQLGIDVWLKDRNRPYGFNERKKLAEQYGIENFSGTAAQNQQLLEILKNNETGRPPSGDELVLASDRREGPMTKDQLMEEIFGKAPSPTAIVPYSLEYTEANRERLEEEEADREQRYQDRLQEEKNKQEKKKAKREKLTKDVLDTSKTLSSQLAPFLNDPLQEDLDPSQILGELTALSTNQLQPVQAQTFQPDLAVAMGDVSLQDQLNANQADFNALQRRLGYNPEALSMLAAQKYAANSKVLGDQFRLNQELRNQVFNKNRELLSDARIKNLGIYDQQYLRQEQARSNTKATFQDAMSSIASKTLQNKLENRTLATMSNMFPQYGFDRNMRAINRGLTFYDMPNFVETGEDVVTSNTTTNPVTNTPSGNNTSGQKHGGKTKKSFANSSILKMYKG